MFLVWVDLPISFSYSTGNHNYRVILTENWKLMVRAQHNKTLQNHAYTVLHCTCCKLTFLVVDHTLSIHYYIQSIDLVNNISVIGKTHDVCALGGITCTVICMLDDMIFFADHDFSNQARLNCHTRWNSKMVVNTLVCVLSQKYIRQSTGTVRTTNVYVSLSILLFIPTSMSIFCSGNTIQNHEIIIYFDIN